MNILQLHLDAMAVAEIADRCKFNLYLKINLFMAASELEHEAAKQTEEQPTRSVLFRSAASLAFEAGDYDRAQDLALVGRFKAPPEIEQEIDDLLEKIREIRGTGLSSKENR